MLIYKITSPSGKIYIGLTTKSFEKRKKEHLRCKKSDQLIHRAIRKYGAENMLWEIIDTATTLKELKQKERYYIIKYDSFNSGYNSTLGGEGVFGLTHSDETKKQLSELTKKQWNNYTEKQKKDVIKNNLNYQGKNKIKIKDSLGNIFNSMTEAAKFHNIVVSAVSLCIKHNYPTRNKVRFEKFHG